MNRRAATEPKQHALVLPQTGKTVTRCTESQPNLQQLSQVCRRAERQPRYEHAKLSIPLSPCSALRTHSWIPDAAQSPTPAQSFVHSVAWSNPNCNAHAIRPPALGAGGDLPRWFPGMRALWGRHAQGRLLLKQTWSLSSCTTSLACGCAPVLCTFSLRLARCELAKHRRRHVFS